MGKQKTWQEVGRRRTFKLRVRRKWDRDVYTNLGEHIELPAKILA